MPSWCNQWFFETPLLGRSEFQLTPNEDVLEQDSGSYFLLIPHDTSGFFTFHPSSSSRSQPPSAAKALWLFHHFPRRWPPFWPVPGLGVRWRAFKHGMPCLTPHVWRFRRNRFFRGDLYLFEKAHQSLKVPFPPKTSQNCQIAHQSRHMAPPDLCPSTWYWPSPLRDRCLSCHAGMVLWSKRICLQCTHHVCSNRPVLAMESRCIKKTLVCFACVYAHVLLYLVASVLIHKIPACLLIDKSIYIPISSNICPSTNFRLSVCIYPSIHPSIRPSVHPSISFVSLLVPSSFANSYLQAY